MVINGDQLSIFSCLSHHDKKDMCQQHELHDASLTSAFPWSDRYRKASVEPVAWQRGGQGSSNQTEVENKKRSHLAGLKLLGFGSTSLILLFLNAGWDAMLASKDNSCKTAHGIHRNPPVWWSTRPPNKLEGVIRTISRIGFSLSPTSLFGLLNHKWTSLSGVKPWLIILFWFTKTQRDLWEQ